MHDCQYRRLDAEGWSLLCFVKAILYRVQGLIEDRLESREAFARSLHAAVGSLESAMNALETWQQQSSIPAEKSLYKAVHKSDKARLPALKVFSCPTLHMSCA